MTAAPYTPTQPEGQGEGVIGPGQAERLEAYLKEQGVEPGLNEGEEQPQEEEQGEQLIAGKFKSQEELEKAYKELERKLGSKAQEREEEPEEKAKPEPVDPTSYSRELGEERYGEAMADLFEQAEFNPLEFESKIESGELELAEAAKQMAKVLPFSEQVIAAYLNGIYEVVDDGQPAKLTTEQEQEVREAVGGDKAFKELVGWAKENLDQGELAAYNRAVALGDPDVALIAARFLQASAQAANAIPRVEPKLVSGKDPAPSALKFETKAQALEAMNKTNSRGQRLYDVDESYRRKIAEVVARSDLF
jgi:hypothetical protein